jgi:hypothetical protein
MLGARFGTRLSPYDRNSAAWYSARDELLWLIWFGLLTLGSLIAAVALVRAGVMGPEPVLFAWIAYVAGAALILIQPRWGIYLIIFLALLGDARLMPAYPFLKNFSSNESLFYISDAYIISALEVYLVITLASWLFRERMLRRFRFHSGELTAPVLFFGLLVVWGLVYGLGFRGGDLRTGLWEARAILYLPLFMVLATNLLRTPSQIRIFFWAAIAGMLVESIIGTLYVVGEYGLDMSQFDRLTEHSAAIHLNALILLAIAVWLYPRGTRLERAVLPLLVLVVALPYLAAQRRAAFISLTIGLVLLGPVLYQQRRRLFWMMLPAAVVGALLYLGAFWNSTNALALPAQAVKSVIARTGASAEDWASNYYRILENINIAFTIHLSPLTGVGFGNPFHIRVAMPDISFFEWWEYITHNSILWIWMKTGVAGFISMIIMIAMSLMAGVRGLALLRRRQELLPGYLQPMAVVALLFVVMHFMFAYVDMSWDAQSMLLLGAMLGIINRLEVMAAEYGAFPLEGEA